MKHNERFTHTISELKRIGNYRFLQNTPQSKSIINLSSNDYLALLDEQELYTDFLAELQSEQYAFSACSSRLLSGNSAEYAKLESLLAKLYKTESALVFNSGYHANCGILPALTNQKDCIIADKYVHASIIDGLQLSSAKFMRYRHLDYEHLEKILEKHRQDYEHVWIVTESIFSMDGDCADMNKLVQLKQKYNTFLYVDEAHALGVRGPQGLGLVEEMNCMQDCDCIVGTFGKAIASVGAFVACTSSITECLLNHARTLIYTTALPPVNIAWTSFIMTKPALFNEKRKKLHTLSTEFADMLSISSNSQIIPIVIGSNKDAIAAAQELQQNGFYVLPIRYPTVPENTARLRFSLHAELNLDDCKKIPEILSRFI